MKHSPRANPTGNVACRKKFRLRIFTEKEAIATWKTTLETVGVSGVRGIRTFRLRNAVVHRERKTEVRTGWGTRVPFQKCERSSRKMSIALLLSRGARTTETSLEVSIECRGSAWWCHTSTTLQQHWWYHTSTTPQQYTPGLRLNYLQNQWFLEPPQRAGHSTPDFYPLKYFALNTYLKQIL